MVVGQRVATTIAVPWSFSIARPRLMKRDNVTMENEGMRKQKYLTIGAAAWRAYFRVAVATSIFAIVTLAYFAIMFYFACIANVAVSGLIAAVSGLVSILKKK